MRASNILTAKEFREFLSACAATAAVAFGVKTKWDGEVLGWIPVEFSNEWKEYRADYPRCLTAYRHCIFVYKGTGAANLASFTLE